MTAEDRDTLHHLIDAAANQANSAEARLAAVDLAIVELQRVRLRPMPELSSCEVARIKAAYGAE